MNLVLKLFKVAINHGCHLQKDPHHHTN